MNEDVNEYVLTVGELSMMTEIIKVSCKNGLIDPSAMVLIGNLYNKLDNIIKAESSQEKLLNE